MGYYLEYGKNKFVVRFTRLTDAMTAKQRLRNRGHQVTFYMRPIGG